MFASLFRSIAQANPSHRARPHRAKAPFQPPAENRSSRRPQDRTAPRRGGTAHPRPRHGGGDGDSLGRSVSFGREPSCAWQLSSSRGAAAASFAESEPACRPAGTLKAPAAAAPGAPAARPDRLILHLIHPGRAPGAPLRRARSHSESPGDRRRAILRPVQKIQTDLKETEEFLRDHEYDIRVTTNKFPRDHESDFRVTANWISA